MLFIVLCLNGSRKHGNKVFFLSFKVGCEKTLLNCQESGKLVKSAYAWPPNEKLYIVTSTTRPSWIRRHENVHCSPESRMDDLQLEMPSTPPQEWKNEKF